MGWGVVCMLLVHIYIYIASSLPRTHACVYIWWDVKVVSSVHVLGWCVGGVLLCRGKRVDVGGGGRGDGRRTIKWWRRCGRTISLFARPLHKKDWAHAVCCESVPPPQTHITTKWISLNDERHAPHPDYLWKHVSFQFTVQSFVLHADIRD